MDFKPVPFSDPVSSALWAAMNESVADLARRIPDAVTLRITPVKGPIYTVKSTDRYLMVDPRSGPVRIALQKPSQRQELTIKNCFTSTNAITVVRIDGLPMGNGKSSAVVTDKVDGSAMNLIDDGSQWWVL